MRKTLPGCRPSATPPSRDRPPPADLPDDSTNGHFYQIFAISSPYSLATVAGRAATFDRNRRHSAAGARMLWLEHIALALNEKQGLGVVFDQFDETLAEGEHGPRTAPKCSPA